VERAPARLHVRLHPRRPDEWRDEVEHEENLFDLPLFNMPAFFFGLRF
jgi:hypothetical protein